jgi:GGDEF domain-containing protein
VFARSGGDEFVVLLTDAEINVTETVIERFRKSVENPSTDVTRGYDILFCVGIVNIDPNDKQTIETIRTMRIS